ncbi:MAG: hypothetical protein ACRESJ_24505, partial [Pseudomonas sp.]|uniref:hypothetical protein n=1 Tax=Pseudomonas sp. TaxID=306 RepID=UPI003D6EE516
VGLIAVLILRFHGLGVLLGLKIGRKYGESRGSLQRAMTWVNAFQMLILRPFHAPRMDKIAQGQNVSADSIGEGVRSDVTECVQTQRLGDRRQSARQPVSTSLCGLSSGRFV